MRMIVVDTKTSLKEVSASLVGEGASAKEAKSSLENLERLNPHVDVKKIPPGTVLLLPDVPRAGETTSVSVQGAAFTALRDQLSASVEAARARVRAGYEAQAAQRDEVTAVLKLAAVKRAIDSDQDLKGQVDQSAEVFKQDQGQAKASDELLKSMQAEASAELDALAKLLG